MSLNKAIEHGKEHRKPKHHKHHKTCPVCTDNLLFQRHKTEEAADKDMKEFEKDDSD